MKMTAYIVDNHKFEIVDKFKDSSYASFAMSDNYAWEPDNRYSMLHDENAAYDYWHDAIENRGDFYEGLGISDDMKHDMFKGWLGD
jgi:hypothetical protein